MTIRSADESVAVENSLDVLEVDLVIAQVIFALFRIPSEVANACEQPLHLFRHSKSLPKTGFRHGYTVEVRYDGFETLGFYFAFVFVMTPPPEGCCSKAKYNFDRTSTLYIQTYLPIVN
jgi:hypothetical protein